MKKVLLSLAAVSAIALTATPAAADHDHRNRVVSPERLINQREAQLDRQIDVALHRGQITRIEARRLQLELRRINQLERHYRRGGLNRGEFNDLNARLQRVQHQLHAAQRNNDWRRYGYNQGSGLSFGIGLGQRW